MPDVVEDLSTLEGPEPVHATLKRASDAHAFELVRVVNNTQMLTMFAGAFAAARALYHRSLPTMTTTVLVGTIASAWAVNEHALYNFGLYVETSSSGRAIAISDIPARARYVPRWYG